MSDIHDPAPSSVSETTVSLFSQLLKWMKKENDLQLIQHRLNKELVDILTSYLEERLRSVPSHRRGPLADRSLICSPDTGISSHRNTPPNTRQPENDRSQLVELLKTALKPPDVLSADEDFVTLYCKRNGEEIALGQISGQMARQLGHAAEVDQNSGGVGKKIQSAEVPLSEDSEDLATSPRSEEGSARSDDGWLHDSSIGELSHAEADAIEDAYAERTKNHTRSASVGSSDEKLDVVPVSEDPHNIDWFRRGRFVALRLRWLPQRSQAERAEDIQLEKEDAEQCVSKCSRNNENFQLFAQNCAEDISEEKSIDHEERGDEVTVSPFVPLPAPSVSSPARDGLSDYVAVLEELALENQPETCVDHVDYGAAQDVPEELLDFVDTRDLSEILRYGRDLADLSPPPWDYLTFANERDRSVENGSESSYEGLLPAFAAVAEKHTCEIPREEGRSSTLPRIAMLFPPLPVTDFNGLEMTSTKAEQPEFVALEVRKDPTAAESPKSDFAVTHSLKSEAGSVDSIEAKVSGRKPKTAILAVPRSVLLKPILASVRSSARYRRSPPGDDSGYSDSRVSSPRIITVDNVLFKEGTDYDDDLARAGSGEQIDLQILSVDTERPAVFAWIWGNPQSGKRLPSEVARLSEALAQVYDGCQKPERQVVLGQPVAVTDMEGRWVRGRVVSYCRAKVTVYLVDMGRQIVKRMDEVWPLDAAFLQAKPLAWRAEIAGIDPLSYTRDVAEQVEELLAKNRRVVGNVTMLDPVVVRLVDETSFCRSVEIATLLHGKLLSKQGRNVEMGVVVHVPGESDLQLEGEPDLVIVNLNDMAELEKTHWRVQDDAFKKRKLLDYSYRGNFAVEHRNAFYRAFFLKNVEDGEAAVELTDYGQRFYAETSRLFKLSHQSEIIPHVRTDCWLESFPKDPKKVDTFRARLRELRQKVVIYEKVSCEDENVWCIRLWNQSMMEFGSETEYLLPKIPARFVRYSAQYRTNQMLMVHVKQTWMTGGTTYAAAFLGTHDRTPNHTLGNQGISDDLHVAMQYDCCVLSPFTEYPGQNVIVAAYSGDKPWSRAETIDVGSGPKTITVHFVDHALFEEIPLNQTVHARIEWTKEPRNTLLLIIEGFVFATPRSPTEWTVEQDLGVARIDAGRTYRFVVGSWDHPSLRGTLLTCA